MAERVTVPRKSSAPPREQQGAASPAAGTAGADLDALLDEIDAALEPNAEEFVRGYVQKGGE